MDKRSIKSALDNETKKLVSIYENHGFEGLVEKVSIDEEDEWETDDVHTALDDDEYIYSLFKDSRFIAGYPELTVIGEENGTTTFGLLDDDEFDIHPVLKKNISLSDEIEINIARFLPEIWNWRKEYLIVISLTLIIILLPISLVSAKVLSSKVTRRLDGMSSVLAKVGDVSIENRLPVAENRDEFDILSENINAMLDRLRLLTRNIENTSVGVAHDLKTPISNVAGRLQLIERDLNDPTLIQAHVYTANENIEKLLRTLDALLRLGEVEAGKRKEAFKPTNLSAIALDLAESFQPVLDESDKHFEYSIEPGILIHGDTDLLVQLFSNLLENAVEHTRDGAAVKLELHAKRGFAEVRVADDGPGIPAHNADHIFDRFHRGDASRSTPGNGLGLSLVRSIAELHDGRAQLQLENGGSCFVVSIPLQS
ncbi:MAG: HAMP domain-containing sensor histidine kinase [Pseudomonadota bacterium]